MTINLNLAGLPALTLPCGFTEDGGSVLPVGLQMVGRAFGEADLLQIAHAFEQTAEFARGHVPQVYAA
jgi:aspartyl-tRNA(Asn)/glutamyl-tRNA(Gln) amidotransferase subunit A